MTVIEKDWTGDVVGGARILDAETLQRTVVRLAREVEERHPGLRDLVVAGIRRGGVPLARAVGAALGANTGGLGAVIELDVTQYRDDRPRPPLLPAGAISTADGDGDIPSLVGRTVVLVDDVLHTGRTLRAALDLLTACGRPGAVEPLVLIDRGRRELPLRAVYVGKNIPASSGQWVRVVVDGASSGAWVVPR